MATTQLTFEEFEKMPDVPGKQELLDGELIEEPPAKLRHANIQQRIQDRLRPFVREHSLGDVRIELGFKLGATHWVQPDVSFVRLAHLEASDPDGYIQGAPALAVEIISESNTAESIDRKLERYFEFGAEEVWVLYPKTRRVWKHCAHDRSAVLHTGMLESDLFPGWILNLDEVFA